MEETFEEIFKNSEKSDDDTDDTVETLLTAVKKRQNELNEKILALKSSTESLKEQLKLEKKKWIQEIQETTELENKMKMGHGDMKSMLQLDEGERNRKLEVFKEYLFFTKTTMNLETELKKKSYQDWLAEIADECNEQLSKVQDNLTVLKPLKEMASRWSLVDKCEENEETHDTDEKGQGDGTTETENTNTSVE